MDCSENHSAESAATRLVCVSGHTDILAVASSQVEQAEATRVRVSRASISGDACLAAESSRTNSAARGKGVGSVRMCVEGPDVQRQRSCGEDLTFVRSAVVVDGVWLLFSAADCHQRHDTAVHRSGNERLRLLAGDGLPRARFFVRLPET